SQAPKPKTQRSTKRQDPIQGGEWLHSAWGFCSMNQEHEILRSLTRRHFFSQCALGLGSIALGSLLNERRALAAGATPLPTPMAPRQPMFAPRAKNIIYLFMAGGPSQLELFDYKPRLVELNGAPNPPISHEGHT